MDYAAYARSIRRELHEYPEIGFDLPKTIAVVKRELVVGVNKRQYFVNLLLSEM